MTALPLIVPDWPAPSRVRAAMTTRAGGVSNGPYASLNLGDHVGDDAAHVAENRARLRAELGLPAEPCWLRQVHGTRVVRMPESVEAGVPEADASWTDRPGVAVAILVADCLPVLFCDDAGEIVAAAHAGWRGLAAGVLEATVGSLPVAPARLLAWLGPAIGPAAFEVGSEVRAAFVAHDPPAAAAFVPTGTEGKSFADLHALARRRLVAAGVTRVHGGGRCTYKESATFFSHRRDRLGGRMAALAWRAF